MSRYRLFFLVFFVVYSLAQSATVKPYKLLLELSDSETSYSFEKIERSRNRFITSSENHYIHGVKSLKWIWRTSKDSLNIALPISYKLRHRPINSGMDVRTIFRVWIYSEKLQKGAIKFSFLKGGKERCTADFKLNFTGWRLMSYPFDVMKGTPVEDMDELQISPNGVKRGKVYFDAMSPGVLEDIRWSWPDSQQSFKGQHKVNTLAINSPEFQRLTKYPLSKKSVKELQIVKEKLKSKISFHYRESEATKIINYIDSLKIVKDEKGVRGNHLSGPTSLQSGEELKPYFEQLLGLAQQCQGADDSLIKKELADKFSLMIEHLLDQGWQDGSSMGASHHMGYSSGRLAPAILLMEDELRTRKLLKLCVRLLFWIGRDFLDFTQAISKQSEHIQKALHARSADYLLTFLNTHFTACLLLEDTKLKANILNNFTQTLSDIVLFENGIIKNDGSLYHHHMHYVGYGLPAITSLVNLVSTLDQTEFEISQKSFDRLKMAVLKSEKWCYPFTGPIATGRHPLVSDRNKSLLRTSLKLSKAVPKSDDIDKELAQSYLRMSGKSAQETYGKKIPLADLEGFWTMNYTAAGLYKKSGYSVQLKGTNQAVRSHETYVRDNRYGRYLGRGSLFVFDNTLSGYQYNGWDWSQVPGTTSLKLPYKVLEGSESYYGWNPPQESNFSGSAHLDNDYGMFVFKTNAGKHDQSIDINQSVLAIDDRLICLGSNLTSQSNKYPLVTTLFQRSFSSLDREILSSDSKLTVMKKGGFKKVLTKPMWLIDSIGIGYIISKSKGVQLKVEKQLQNSLHDKNKTATEGLFAKAYLDFGTEVKSAGYEYVMMLGATPEKLTKYVKSKPFYNVLRKDDRVHIVSIPTKRLKVYAVFSPVKEILNDEFIHSSDFGLITFVRNKSRTLTRMSVTHPTIEKRDLFDSIKPQTFEIILNGRYAVKARSKAVSSTINGTKTSLKMNLRDAETLHFDLIKK